MTCLILQDNDFVKDGVKVTIGEEAKSKLMETLSADVQFLIKWVGNECTVNSSVDHQVSGQFEASDALGKFLPLCPIGSPLGDPGPLGDLFVDLGPL